MTSRMRPWANTYWVADLNVLAGEYPGDLDPARARAKLEGLVAAGVRSIVDLTRPEDGLDPYHRHLADVTQPLGVAVAHHPMPIEDNGIPTPRAMRAILDRIAADQGRDAVYVHCWGGVGRTGTVVGCLLVEQGYLPDKALAAVDAFFATTAQRRWHPRSPQTAEQVAFVRAWHPGAGR